MSKMTVKRVERMAAACGMRERPSQPRHNVRWDVGGILAADVLETIQDWEDVDADQLRAACSRGEVLNSDG